MRLTIRHTTQYRYEGAVGYAIQRLHLTPINTDMQRVISWKIEAPGIETGLMFQDGFGNIVHLVNTSLETEGFDIVAHGVVDVVDRAGVQGMLAGSAPPALFLRHTPATTPDAILVAMGRDIMASHTQTGAQLHALMNAVHGSLTYETGVTSTTTSAMEAMALRSGVCQDYAHVFLAVARTMGIASRYVSGYLATGIGQSDVASHAWVEAFVPPLGWIAFDPTNNICPTVHHVRLAAGLDASGVAPVRGSRRGGLAEHMSVTVSIQAGEQ